MSEAQTVAPEGLDEFPPGSKGVRTPVKPTRRGDFLSDVIVELELSDEATVEEAVLESRQAGKRVEELLLSSGAIDEKGLSFAVAERNGLPHVDLEEFDVDLDAASLIPRSVASRYRAVPIAFSTDGALIVALEDPVNSLVIDDLEVMTKSHVRIVVAAGSEIETVIEFLPDVEQPPRSSSVEVGGEGVAAQANTSPAAEAEAASDAEEEPTGGDLESVREDLRRMEALVRDCLTASKELAGQLADIRSLLEKKPSKKA